MNTIVLIICSPYADSHVGRAGDVRLPAAVQLDDIKVEYHPKSGRPTTIHPFEEFKRNTQQEPDIPPSSEPWSPFKSRADFEFAEIVLQASLNTRHTDALIKLFRRVVDEQAEFTFTSHADLKRSFDTAALAHTPVRLDYLSSLLHLQLIVFSVVSERGGEGEV